MTERFLNRFSSTIAIVVAITGCIASISRVRAETVVCPVTRDIGLSSVGTEADGSPGKAGKIKLKGYQELGLFDFAVDALKGRRVISAVLRVFPAGGMKYGGAERGTDLRWFTVSTVGTDWEEGQGARQMPDEAGLGASFNEAKHKTRAWAYPGSKLYDVTLGNGQSLRWDVDAGDPQQGWMVIPIEPRLIQALVTGASHGLLLMDGSVFLSTNSYIAARESKTPPQLVVTVADGEMDATPPAAPAEGVIEPAPNDADAATGAARVSFSVPANAFAYLVTLNGRPGPRWQIPFATKAGGRQSFLLEFMEPDAELKMEIAAVDAAGNVSPAATFTGRSSPAITVPPLPPSTWQPKGAPPPVIAEKIAVWAVPEICKVDALGGAVIQEPGMEHAAEKNAVWDAATGAIRISAARGEIAAFQLACKTLAGGAANELEVRLEAPAAASGSRSGPAIASRLWRAWHVKVKDTWLPDYAIPMAANETLKIPDPQNAIPGQTTALVAFDLSIPAGYPTGDHEGAVIVTLRGGDGRAGATPRELRLPLKLHVYAATIPPEMHFIPELNCYHGPLGDAGSAPFNDAMKLAHYHRNSINRVPHSHSGRTDADWVPQVDANGHVTDWSGFDQRLGPLLDGSLFRDNPRAGIPVPALYLPFNESWPLPIGPNYAPGKDVPLIGDDWLPRHNILAVPPEQAFNDHYKQAFSGCVAEFVRHFEDKGWTRTLAEGFNNNKVQYGNIQQKDATGVKVRVKAMTGTAWTLDEPGSLLDWQGLKFYSTLFHRGLTQAKTARFVYRGDISRPQWQGSYLDGLMEVMVSNGSLFNMTPLMRHHRQRMPAMIMAYGSCNSQDRANHEATAWALKAYTHGCDGVLPWQSLGTDAAFDKGDFTGADGAASSGNALIVDGSHRFGINAIASFRVHAFRQGAQLVELLRLLEEKRHWSRAHSLALVSQSIPLDTEYRQKFTDDAARLTFDHLNGDALVYLKESLLRLLEPQP